MATAVEYGLVAAGISVAIIAVVHRFTNKITEIIDPERPKIITVINMVPTKSAAVPADLAVLLAPDLTRIYVWGGNSYAKK